MPQFPQSDTEKAEWFCPEYKGPTLGRSLQNRTAAVRSTAKSAAAEALPRARWEAELLETENRLASNPSSADLRFRRAFWLSELGRLVDARDAYIKVLECEPHHLGALNNLGSALRDLGYLEEAVASLQLAVRLRPDHAEAHGNLGNALQGRDTRPRQSITSANRSACSQTYHKRTTRSVWF